MKYIRSFYGLLRGYRLYCIWFTDIKDILDFDKNYHVSSQFDIQITIALILAAM